MAELTLTFPNENQVMVEYGGDRTTPAPFVSPLTDEDREDIRWYLEVYGTQYTIDLDDGRAARIAGRLKEWGEALFGAAFGNDHAKRIFWRFYDNLEEDGGGLITIDTGAPAVLSLPWELLCLEGRHMVHENPHVSVRRRLTGAAGTGRRFTPASKEILHMLFVVSRPKGAGFIDPRADAMAVMDALDQNAPGRVTVEFLRPATLDNLTNRLKCQGPEHRGKPKADILHFDGHGVFDASGHLFSKAKESDPAAATRDGGEKDIQPDTGYLLFEDEKGEAALITAETLGNMLTHQKVALTVLSACQSGAVGAGGDDEAETGKARAINGVAARLIGAGLPAVIAMSHTVLVETTRQLFGQFYARLGDHMGVGAALDEARQHLYAHPERGERRRGEHDHVILRLYDWFLPALYQTGADVPLLTGEGGAEEMSTAETDRGEGQLPKPPESGFFGRSGELWGIERAFTDRTRRVTVTGFGGQGKTALAAEAGQWLVRSGMFRRCCFVSFAAFQGVDPLAYAVSCLSVALDQNLINADAAEAALKATPTLVILDNLESLTGRGEDCQPPLLDAAARWSRAGESRVLITTRQPRLEHPDFPAAGSREHQYLSLSGLARHDAVALFMGLWDLPPEPEPHITEPPARRGLEELFGQVDYHPLSISLLAYQLKSRRIAELGERLESLLRDAPGEGAEKNLRVSLDLSLERLSAEAREWLPRLGVFQGGGMEDVVLQVTGLGRADEDPQIAQLRQLLEVMKSGDPKAFFRMMGKEIPEGIELPEEIQAQIREKFEEDIPKIEAELAKHQQTELAQGADESTWPLLRGSLETAGLIRIERLEGVAAPYLKFHPALAPALWERLSDPEKEDLAARHRAVYYRLSGKLYHQDDREPHAARAVARRELPNLLFSVKAALAAGEEDAVDFVDKVNKILGIFGLLRDRDDLIEKAERGAWPGTKAWFLAKSNKGQALFGAGLFREAEAIFLDILDTMEDAPSYERCITMGRLGCCLLDSGRPAVAVKVFREGIVLAEALQQSNSIRRMTGTIQTNLADSLADLGDFSGARCAYEASLKIDMEFGDLRGAAVSNAQIGTLSIREGNFEEAERQYREALQFFRRLNEPASEATIQHQLCILYYKTQKWQDAEAACRESARLAESMGNHVHAAETYSTLADLMVAVGRPAEAETWYRRSIDIFEASGNRVHFSKTCNNLAVLLLNEPERLSEARQLAEQALAIKKTLDPGAAEIWTSYYILAMIAEKQASEDGIDTAEKAPIESEAREYRRLAREARTVFKGTQHQLKPLLPLIKLIFQAANGNGESRKKAETIITGLKEDTSHHPEMAPLVQGIKNILNGEREIIAIDNLDLGTALILQQILEAVKNPEILDALLVENESQSSQTESTRGSTPRISPRNLRQGQAPDRRTETDAIIRACRSHHPHMGRRKRSRDPLRGHG